MNLRHWYPCRLLETTFAPREENIVWALLLQTARKRFFQDYRLLIWSGVCAVLPLGIPERQLYFVVPAIFGLSVTAQMLFFRSAFILKRQLMKEGKAAELLSLPLSNEDWYRVFARFFYTGFTAIQAPLLLTGFLLFTRILLPAGYAPMALLARAAVYTAFAGGFFISVAIFPTVFAGYWILLGWNRDLIGIWVVGVIIPLMLACVLGYLGFALYCVIGPIFMVMVGWVSHDCCRSAFSEFLRRAVFERER